MDFTFALLEFEKFILILVRMSCFVVTAPFFNMANTPARTKIGFSIVVSMLLYSVFGTTMVVEYANDFEYASLAVKEAVVGLLIGFSANICMLMVQFAGKIIDLEIGLAMASIFDPNTKTETGIIGTLYYDMVLLLLIVSNLHSYLIMAIKETFEIIPIGKMTINPSLYDTFVEFAGAYFSIGFRIALPVFAAILLLNIVLAIMARVAPQMNMFVVGMQLKIIVGLVVVFITIGLLPKVSNFIYVQIRQIVTNVVEGMV